MEQLLTILNFANVNPRIKADYKSSKRSLLTTLLRHFARKQGSNSPDNLSIFNSYLKVLVKRIAKVTLVLTELKRRRSQRPHSVNRSPVKRKESRQIMDLVRTIEQLTNRLSQSIPPAKAERCSAERSYTAWIEELKESKQGRKLMRKIERILLKTLQKEREEVQKTCEEKFETQKTIIKLHYKQKLLEHVQALNLSSEPFMVAATKTKRERTSHQTEPKPSNDIDDNVEADKENWNIPERKVGQENNGSGNEQAIKKPLTDSSNTNAESKVKHMKKIEDMIKESK